ncbi:MAG: hypothetical protein KAZ30_01770 [Candidatus Magasanikbacteria bacterium]|nr:hypothetical protein [Candidatus Magasanikbacteria bacterium]
MSTPIFVKICALLDEKEIEYKKFHHEVTRTSEDAARIRGVDLHSGAKALVVCGSKTKKHYLCVIPADLRLDSKKVRALVGENISFAGDPEAVTGCVPGSVPPLGSVLGIQTLCDSRLSEVSVINFNAGSLTDSIQMKYTDYLIVEQPQITDIT